MRAQAPKHAPAFPPGPLRLGTDRLCDSCCCCRGSGLPECHGQRLQPGLLELHAAWAAYVSWLPRLPECHGQHLQPGLLELHAAWAAYVSWLPRLPECHGQHLQPGPEPILLACSQLSVAHDLVLLVCCWPLIRPCVARVACLLRAPNEGKHCVLMIPSVMRFRWSALGSHVRHITCLPLSIS